MSRRLARLWPGSRPGAGVNRRAVASEMSAVRVSLTASTLAHRMYQRQWAETRLGSGLQLARSRRYDRVRGTSARPR